MSNDDEGDFASVPRFGEDSDNEESDSSTSESDDSQQPNDAVQGQSQGSGSGTTSVPRTSPPDPDSSDPTTGSPASVTPSDSQAEAQSGAGYPQPIPGREGGSTASTEPEQEQPSPPDTDSSTPKTDETEPTPDPDIFDEPTTPDSSSSSPATEGDDEDVEPTDTQGISSTSAEQIPPEPDSVASPDTTDEREVATTPIDTSDTTPAEESGPTSSNTSESLTEDDTGADEPDEPDELEWASASQATSDAPDQTTEPDDEPAAPEEPSFDPPDEDRDWSREVDRVYEPAESQLETLQRIDEFLDEIDEDLPTARERVRASEHFELYDRAQRDTRAQSKLGFDYVREDGIAVDGEDYIGIVNVEPRNWRTLSDEQKRQVVGQYMSFLMQLKHAIAIPCYPREFDLTRHLEKVYETGVRQATENRNPIFDYGRKYYQVWLDNKVDTDNIKHRDYYVVFRVKKEHIAGGITNDVLLSRIPVIGSLYNLGIQLLSERKTDDEIREEVCIKEVQKRQERIVRTLNSTGVNPEAVTDRQETMEILYHYYNHVEPKLQEFNHATGIFDVREV